MIKIVQQATLLKKNWGLFFAVPLLGGGKIQYFYTYIERDEDLSQASPSPSHVINKCLTIQNPDFSVENEKLVDKFCMYSAYLTMENANLVA